MMATPYAMRPPILWRTELYPGGAERRLKRTAPNRTPSGVWKTRSGPVPVAYVYICPITKHHVVATRSDTRLVGERYFVCYQSFQQRDAAVMYALLLGG